MTQREAFEAWWHSLPEDEWYGINDKWMGWQAATAAERERCAKVCESLERDACPREYGAGPGEFDYHEGSKCAAAIREG